MTRDSRPLSPHLQVYRRTYTMALSILHRISGIVLSVAFLGLAAWLIALAAGSDCYLRFRALADSGFGRLVIAGLVLAFWYHFCAGIRHLVFDLGIGLERREARRSGAILVAAVVLLTLVTLGFLYTGGAQ